MYIHVNKNPASIYIYTQINIDFRSAFTFPTSSHNFLLEVGIHHNKNWRDPFFHCHLNRIPRFQTRMSGSSQKFSPSNRSQTSVRSYKTKCVPKRNVPNFFPLVSFQTRQCWILVFGKFPRLPGFPSSKKKTTQTITAHGGK